MKTTLKYFANALSSTCRVIVALITVTVFISDAIAGPSGRFIRSTNSPRANAMGGADLLLTDQESVFNNPSSMALYHLNTYFSATFPLRTEWMPIHTDDYRITALSASIATPVFSKHNQVTSIGFSYYKLHYGTIVRTDGSGNVTGFSKLFEDAFELSVGLAKRGSVNLGFGANIGYLRVGGLDGSTLQLEDGNHLSLLIDIAAMAEGSFQPNQSPQSRSDFRYRVSALITPYSQKLWYVDKADASPGPAVFETGVGISAEFGNPMLRDFSALVVFQHELDISSAEVRVPDTKRAGLELGLVEMIFLRAGIFDNGSSGGTLPTFGAGFSLYGLIKVASGDKLEDYLRKNAGVDVRFDIAKYANDDIHPLAGTSFWKLSFAWHMPVRN